MSAIFFNDETLNYYEQEEQWDNCVRYLNALVDSQPQNRSVLYRFAAESWYVLTFWNIYMPKDKLKKNFFEESLKKAYILAKERWWTDSNCLWLFGYFMCINQIVFPYVSTDIREVEYEGNSLIYKAYFNNPNNQLAKVLYLAESANKHKYATAITKIKKYIKTYFPHQSEVDQYFTEVFTNKK